MTGAQGERRVAAQAGVVYGVSQRLPAFEPASPSCHQPQPLATHTHTRTQAHTHTHTHTQTRTLTQARTHTRHILTDTHTHTRVHTRTTRPWTRMPIADKHAHGRHTRSQASPTIARARRQAYPIQSYQSPITVKWFAPGWVSLTHDTRARRGSTSILFSHGPFGQACIVSWVRRIGQSALERQ